MTSSNGNIFRVTGHLCGEFTGPGEIQAQRPVTRSFDVFFHLRLNKRFSKQPRGWWFETPAPGVYDVIVMWWTNNICCVRSSVDYSWSRYLLNSNTVISPNYHWNSQLASLNKETLPNNFASNKEVSYKSSYPSKIFMIDISYNHSNFGMIYKFNTIRVINFLLAKMPLFWQCFNHLENRI